MTTKFMLSNITKKEWLTVSLIALITIIIVIAPYLFGYLTTPQNMIFTGVTFDQDYSYFSMMEQAKEGKILFKNLYTSEDHQAIFFRPLFLGMGLFAKFLHLSNFFVFHLFKIIFIAIFIFLAYKFISIFFIEKVNRIICLAILLFSSGFGFLGQRLFGYLSSDLWIPESQTFASFFTQPHFILSQILILICFIFLLKKELRFAFLAGLANFVLGLEHPFDLPVTLLVPFVYFVILYFWKKENRILNYLVYGAISVIPVIYQYWTMKIEPIAKAWNDQNILKSPEILAWIIGYGIITIFAIIGFLKFFKTKNKNLLFINIWAVVNIFLLYLPVNFQRRMSEGLHIPLTILATFGILMVYNFLNKKSIKHKIHTHIPKVAFLWIVALSLPFSNINRVANYFNNYAKAKALPYYFSQDYYQATKYFNDNKISDQTILASQKNGPFISGLTTNRVYLGFVFQTKDYFIKKDTVAWFFKDNQKIKQKQEFLQKRNIKYILYGPEEIKLGKIDLNKKDFLDKVYQNDSYAIYKINDKKTKT